MINDRQNDKLKAVLVMTGMFSVAREDKIMDECHRMGSYSRGVLVKAVRLRGEINDIRRHT